MTSDSSGWQLQAGAVHGIVAPIGTESTRLALFDDDTETLSDLTQAAAQAECERRQRPKQSPDPYRG